MRAKGYSLVEVLLAAAVISVGLAAATVLIGALMRQEEANAVGLRAANLQEQAVQLFRLGVPPETIPGLLPEPTTYGSSPPSGGYAISFSVQTNVFTVDGTDVAVEVADCRLVQDDSSGEGADNTVTVVRPTIRR